MRWSAPPFDMTLHFPYSSKFPVGDSRRMFFRNPFVRAFMMLVMNREAGENPALPRNCKRAKLTATVHSHGKATAAI